MSIDFNIKKLREAEGLTQTELAERLGVDQSMISHIENGRKDPGVKLLIDIAEVLHCTTDELVAKKK